MSKLMPEPRRRVTHSGGEHVFHLAERMKISWLTRHFPARIVWAGYVFVNCLLTMAALSALAVVARTPFIFPSLGPTAYLVFFAPLAPASRPRHAILGHAIGLLCGYGSLLLAGSGSIPHGIQHGVDWPTVASAAISLAATGALMVLFRVSHPPAGATTLIVSLGLLSKPVHLVIVEIAVLLLLIQAYALNRFAGLPYPVWEREEM